MSAPSSETRTFHMIEAVADHLEGAPRQLRRRWSDEFKAQVVAEALEPGASVYRGSPIGSAFTRRSSSPGVAMLGPSGIIARGTRVARVCWRLWQAQ
ncbi:transposase [Bradyrhizobium japonicum]|uniref:transposase n=1 Tax=Bradyrhizobium japonicum TaxID=375 RepID=UPI0009BE481E